MLLETHRIGLFGRESAGFCSCTNGSGGIARARQFFFWSSSFRCSRLSLQQYRLQEEAEGWRWEGRGEAGVNGCTGGGGVGGSITMSLTDAAD